MLSKESNEKMQESRIYIRVDKEIKEKLIQVASFYDLPVATYVKKIIFEQLSTVETDPHEKERLNRYIEKYILVRHIRNDVKSMYFFLNKMERLRDIYGKSVIYDIPVPIGIMASFIKKSLVEFGLLPHDVQQQLMTQKDKFKRLLDENTLYKQLSLTGSDFLRIARK